MIRELEGAIAALSEAETLIARARVYLLAAPSPDFGVHRAGLVAAAAACTAEQASAAVRTLFDREVRRAELARAPQDDGSDRRGPRRAP